MTTTLAVVAEPDRGTTPDPARRHWRALVLVLLLAAAVVTASLLVGSRTISPAALFDSSHPQHPIALARFPRTALALAVGAALALSGACMQGLTRNPLADPGILGVTAGASFAMVVAISFVGISTLTGRLFFALLGAALAAVLVHALAGLGRDGATPVKLAIAGAALTAALTSWTSGILLSDRRTMEVFRFWQVGTVGGRGWDVLAAGAPFLVLGVLLAAYGARVLDLLALGDDLARGLGRRVWLDRAVVGLAIVLLAGAATALAGPIAFVGLVVPHAVRALVGAHHTRLLPWSAVGGALLVTAADTLGRVVLPPTEVQVGIMTAVVGLPFFFHLIRRGRVSGL
ncbi:FecCD family ABC transporter permease [Nocardioides houyundeii]|uniref:FecCD family ABC transporter permease n=1 Tax=Nocardioides houyundeii TaxID=2045452 RepID=UPI001F083DFF|nr:iron ABC transporter permease [Nocardioides houyundeii]